MVLPTSQNIDDLTGAALAELSALDSLEAVEQWRIAYLGRRGRLTTVLRGLSGLDIDERRRVGALANQAKASLESGLEARTREINDAALLRAASEDRLGRHAPRPPAGRGQAASHHPDSAGNLRRVRGDGIQRRGRSRS